MRVGGADPVSPSRKDAFLMDFHDTVRTFTDYYRDHGHELLHSSSLLPPRGDDSVLFTTSGMHHLTPYLLGRPHPLGRRLSGLQRCLRTTDLDEVGDRSHLTVFEMLGTWSLGDYGVGQSLRWGYGLLTDGFGLPPGSLHVTVWGGDSGDSEIGPDLESLRTWQELGVPVEPLGQDNWWSNGPTGPCGPDSEIFVWTGSREPRGTPSTDPGWVEVWNHVMMRYDRLEDGSLVPLRQRCVDTGMGFERLLTILQGTDSVYECDVFRPWQETVPSLWPLELRESRVVVDHLRSSMVVIGDGVLPSNSGRGYVLRRLLRRVLTILWSRGCVPLSLEDLPLPLYEHTLERFGLLGEVTPGGVTPGEVRGVILDEQRRFVDMVERGRKLLTRRPPGRVLDEPTLRFLHETHGLPREIVEMISGE
jgi:alanyl-tRNA synthetase